MNQLSWLLYAADVANNLGWIIGRFELIGVIALVIWAITGFCMVDSRHTELEYWKTWRKLGFTGIPLLVVLLVVGALIPSKDTVYGIAASEMGEKFSKTQTFNKAEAALNAWLDRQISPKQEEKK